MNNAFEYDEGDAEIETFGEVESNTSEDFVSEIDRDAADYGIAQNSTEFEVKDSSTRGVPVEEQMENKSEKKYVKFVKSLIPIIQSEEYIDKIKQNYGGHKDLARSHQELILEGLNNYVQDEPIKVSEAVKASIKKQEEQKNSKNYDNESERNEFAKTTRQNTIDFINKLEYLDKLAIEFDGDIEKAKKEQNRRIELVKRVIIDANDNDVIEDAGGDYNYLFNYINVYSRIKGQNFQEAMKHEILHSSTRANWRIPERTEQILTKSYKDGFGSRYAGKSDYYSMPAERIVRKELLDRDLEKYGVKRYGEQFTKEHYEKLMLLKGLDLLSRGADEFVDTTKLDFETYQEIFNEIADSDVQKNTGNLVA